MATSTEAQAITTQDEIKLGYLALRGARWAESRWLAPCKTMAQKRWDRHLPKVNRLSLEGVLARVPFFDPMLFPLRHPSSANW